MAITFDAQLDEADVRISPACHLPAVAVLLSVVASIGDTSAHRVAVRRTGATRAHGTAVVTVHVVARDYALHAPDTLRAGRTEFELENAGGRVHELIVALVRPGTTAADIMAAHQRGLTLRQLPGAYLDGIAGGALFAAPGASSPATLTVSLASGRDYVLLCQLRDTVGASTHAMLGMFHLVHVK